MVVLQAEQTMHHERGDEESNNRYKTNDAEQHRNLFSLVSTPSTKPALLTPTFASSPQTNSLPNGANTTEHSPAKNAATASDSTMNGACSVTTCR